MQQKRLFKQVLLISVAILCQFSFYERGHASRLIGGESLAVECYIVSQAASRNGASNRTDLGVCTRAIDEAHLSTENLIPSYVNRGIIYMAMGNYKKALSDLDHALKLDDMTGEAYVNRGNLWFSQNKLEKAIEDYNQAIKLGVIKLDVAYLNRGITHESLGYLSAAERDYKAALAIQPAWPQALSKLKRVTQSIQQELIKRESRSR